MEHNTLVTIYRAENKIEAAEICGLLENEGIKCLSQPDFATGAMPGIFESLAGAPDSLPHAITVQTQHALSAKKILSAHGFTDERRSSPRPDKVWNLFALGYMLPAIVFLAFILLGTLLYLLLR